MGTAVDEMVGGGSCGVGSRSRVVDPEKGGASVKRTPPAREGRISKARAAAFMCFNPESLIP